MNKFKQKGISLLQLMLVLVISSFLISISMLFYLDSRNQADFKDLNYNLSSLFFNVSNMFARGETGVLDTRMAKTAGLIPSAMVWKNNMLENVFGGEVRIYGKDNPNKITPISGVRSFEVQYYRVPQALCARLLNNQIKIGWHGFSVSPYSVGVVAANTKYVSSDGEANNLTSGSIYLKEKAMIDVCSIDEDYVNMVFIFDSDF